MPKLLVVDDEVDVREFAKSFFKKRNITVETAENGLEAIDKIASFQPDLILLDVTMDGLTGVEVLKKIRSSGNDVKVIMVTGIEDEQIINEVNSWGIKGYIHKPLILEELEQIVLAELQTASK